MEFQKRDGKHRCVICLEQYSNKPWLLDHMKAVHGILQPYQCFVCLKRYASTQTLWRHRHHVCRGGAEGKVETGTYSISSYINNCQLENWTAIYGDRLQCLRSSNGDAVAVVYCGETVGYVPQYLSSIFSRFLWNGTITAKIAGAVVEYEKVCRVPVDYICHGDRQSLTELITDVENQVPDDNTCLDAAEECEISFDKAEHSISRISQKGKKKYPQKRCVVCRMKGTRHDTRYYCETCNTALCKSPCFKEYHSM